MAGSWYNLQDGEWPLGLIAIHMVNLPTGKVLVWSSGTGVWVWNPQGRTSVEEDCLSNIFCAGQSGLEDGKVFVAGGHVVNFEGLKDTNIFDPQSQQWTTPPPSKMEYVRWYPTCTTLPDGRLLTISGSKFRIPPPDNTIVYATIPEVYLPDENVWSQFDDADLLLPLYPFMFVMPDGQVFEAGPNTDTRILDLVALQWSAPITTSPTAGGHTGSAVMYGSKVMKCGGYGTGQIATDATAVIDLADQSPAWTNVGSMNDARNNLNLVLIPDGTALAFGGSTIGHAGGDPVTSVEQFDTGAETWTDLQPTGSMTDDRMYHSSAVLLQDATVLVAGGDGKPNADIFSPPYLDGSPTRPTIASAPSEVEYGQQFQVQADPGGGVSIDKITLLRLGAVTHSFDQNQRFLSLVFQDSDTEGTFDVTPPNDPNAAPPGYYMLFVLNDDGVPSVAEYVRVWDGLDHAYPASVSVWQGSITGDETDVLQSDNSYLVIDPATAELPEGEPLAGVEVTTTAPDGTVSDLTFTLEAHTTDSQTVRIFLYDYSTSQWEEIYIKSSSVQDSVVEVTISSNPGRFLSSADPPLMKARVGWFAASLISSWQAKIDHVLWSIKP